MSRTEAHAPYWTYAVWWEPSHGIWCNRRYPCNLPEQPVRHAGPRTRVTVGLCTWEPVWPSWREASWLVWKSHTPRWFIRHVWSGSERVRERTELGEMVKEYNATGELDDGDFPIWQARHSAKWLWD